MRWSRHHRRCHFAQREGMTVTSNLARIREAIGTNSVKLIAVTKTATPSQVEEAFASGVTEFGENRLQDAMKRREQLPPNVATNCNWHFIGHLQTNKVKQGSWKVQTDPLGRFSSFGTRNLRNSIKTRYYSIDSFAD